MHYEMEVEGRLRRVAVRRDGDGFAAPTEPGTSTTVTTMTAAKNRPVRIRNPLPPHPHDITAFASRRMSSNPLQTHYDAAVDGRPAVRPLVQQYLASNWVLVRSTDDRNSRGGHLET